MIVGACAQALHCTWRPPVRQTSGCTPATDLCWLRKCTHSRCWWVVARALMHSLLCVCHAFFVFAVSDARTSYALCRAQSCPYYMYHGALHVLKRPCTFRRMPKALACALQSNIHCVPLGTTHTAPTGMYVKHLEPAQPFHLTASGSHSQSSMQTLNSVITDADGARAGPRSHAPHVLHVPQASDQYRRTTCSVNNVGSQMMGGQCTINSASTL